MIGAWIGYCVLCASGLALAALIAERVLVAGRAPVRFVWMIAVALSTLVPLTAYGVASRPLPREAASLSATEVVAEPIVVAPVTSTGSVGTGEAPVSGPDWRSALASLDRPLAIGWIALSIVLAVNLVGGLLTLTWMRRRWRSCTVLEERVYVSERTGPAVVGLVSPAIVVPEWVLAMEPSRLSLVLRHEQEHRRAGDGRMLALAQLALLVMPWNLALWWQIRRLRVAVELDCDARVLRSGDVRFYGDLLLDVARPRQARLIGVTAFAERAVELERRIHLLSRHRVRTSRKAGAVASLIGLVALTAAWVAPVPWAPPRVHAESVLMERGAADDGASSSDALAGAVTRDAPVGDVIGAVSGRAVVVSVPRRQHIAPVDAPAVPLPATVACEELGDDAASVLTPYYDRLFEGITLTPGQTQRACAILLRLRLRQDAEDQIAALAVREDRARVAGLIADRDSALGALLTNENDRAVFDANAAETPVVGWTGGGGGRGGFAGDTVAIRARARGVLVTPTAPLIHVDSVRVRRDVAAVADTVRSVLREIEARGAGGARGRTRGAAGAGGRGVARADVVVEGIVQRATPVFAALSSDAAYNRLFRGIILDRDQELAARAIIRSVYDQILDRPIRFNAAVLRINPLTGSVAMRAEDAALLLDVVTNDADRELLRSRIASGV